MPNVAGREFPYTPQGMAAADRYRQSQGMRHGGMMGFRPLGYAKGGDVTAANDDMYSKFKEALGNKNIKQLNEFLYSNSAALESMAEANPARRKQLEDVKQQSGFPVFMKDLMQGIDTYQHDLEDPAPRVPSVEPPQKLSRLNPWLEQSPSPWDIYSQVGHAPPMPPQIEQLPQSGFPEFRKALRDQAMLGEQDVVGSPNLPVGRGIRHGGIVSIRRR